MESKRESLNILCPSTVDYYLIIKKKVPLDLERFLLECLRRKDAKPGV